MKTFSEVKQAYWDKLVMYVPIVDRVHGNSHPEFHEVKRVFDDLVDQGNYAQGFSELRQVTNNYTVPSDTCETYEAVYHMLKELDEAYTE